MKRKAVLVVSVMAVALVLASGAAPAATLTVNDGTLAIVDTQAEENHITGKVGDGVLTITDEVPLRTSNLPRSCKKVSSNTVQCGAQNIERLKIHLGDGDDEVDLRRVGTRIPATVYGEMGNDLIDPTGTDDRIYGGSGMDVMYGGVGRGDDSLSGGPDDDSLSAERGGDAVSGGDGFDFIFGGAGTDALTGDNGNDYVFGEEDKDSIVGGLGTDNVYGGSGSDTLSGNGGNDDIEGGAGEDAVSGNAGYDRLYLKDGQRDTGSCGEGRDETSVDPQDVVSDSCETVSR